MISSLEPTSYAGIFVLLVLAGTGFPLPEDLPLLATGVLLHQGQIRVLPALLIAWAGILCGDTILYGIGRRYGTRVIRSPRLGRILTPRRLEVARGWLRHYGLWTIAGARFLPGLRAPTYLSAGSLGLPFPRFLFADAVAASVTAPIWIAMGYLGSDRVAALRRDLGRAEHWLALLAVVALAWLLGRGLTRLGRRKAA